KSHSSRARSSKPSADCCGKPPLANLPGTKHARGPMRFSLIIVLIVLNACSTAPEKRFFVCEALLPAFMSEGEHAEVTGRKIAPDDPRSVIIEYIQHAPFLDRQSSLSCTFTTDERGGRLGLVAVEE